MTDLEKKQEEQIRVLKQQLAVEVVRRLTHEHTAAEATLGAIQMRLPMIAQELRAARAHLQEFAPPPPEKPHGPA